MVAELAFDDGALSTESLASDLRRTTRSSPPSVFELRSELSVVDVFVLVSYDDSEMRRIGRCVEDRDRRRVVSAAMVGENTGRET